MATTVTSGASAYSLERFLECTSEKSAGDELFTGESARMLRIELDGGVWIKAGAAIAYRGNIVFRRLPPTAASSLSSAALREVAPLVRAEGRGRLFCGHHGSHVRIVRLAGETIVVSAQEILAFEESLAFELHLVGHGVGLAAGGLATVTLCGHGALAIVTHGEPLTLPVTPGYPVSTDPHATLAWSGELTPTLKTDLEWRSLIGHGGAEPIQMLFAGSGFVVVQPFEDPNRLATQLDPIGHVKSLVTG